MRKQIQINGRTISNNTPPYIIAEMSANHQGDIEQAFAIMAMAKKRGADAVKIQTYSADTMTIDCDLDDFQIQRGLWEGYNLYQLYVAAQTPFAWHPALFAKAKELDITLLSTPFDETAVDLLEDLHAPAYKIASFEVIDLPLIEYVARTGKPLIISTGMATLDEIKAAVTTAKEAGCKELALLHCVSGYPTPVEQANLLTISTMQQQFDSLIGLSDHTLGTAAAVTSVALGARIIEKHVTLDRAMGGVDADFSLEPKALQQLVQDCHSAFYALGTAGYEIKPAEQENIIFRRSIYVVEDIRRGEILTEKNIRRIRPGYGLAPKYYPQVLHRRANQDIKRGSALQWDMFS